MKLLSDYSKVLKPKEPIKEDILEPKTKGLLRVLKKIHEEYQSGKRDQ